MGVNRYVPRTREQYLTSVLTLWNLLDRSLEVHRGRLAMGFGYMRPVQLEAYSQLAFAFANDNVTYCEIGFNGGHGAVAMLLANTNLVAHSFDLATNGPYVLKNAQLVRTYFGTERFHFHRGDSHITVPAFASAGGQGICDILLVDGDHRQLGAYRDIFNMQRLAKRNAVLLIDDIDGPPGDALRKAESEGIVKVSQWHVYNRSDVRNPCVRRLLREPVLHCQEKWGWAMASYARGGRGGNGAGDGVST